jgi:uncharacterized protein (TIGR00255 family)
MLESMTGFGRGSAAADGLDLVVEVRTVNSRYVEVAVRAPRELAAYEVEIQNRARAALERGKVSITVQLERATTASPLRVDEVAARAHIALLERVRFLAGIQEPVALEHLLQFRDIFTTEAEAAGEEALWSAAGRALSDALEACVRMRRREGEALAEDLRARLATIEDVLVAVEAAAPRRVVAARDALRQRLADLLNGEKRVDPDRLELEVALIADRLDVTEECVRLRSHLAQFRAALDDEDAAGRRLNFLAQELNREINTIASKANDPSIAHRAVAMKEELEKIREQVQNVV